MESIIAENPFFKNRSKDYQAAMSDVVFSTIVMASSKI
jgi:hypothetical protein